MHTVCKQSIYEVFVVIYTLTYVCSDVFYGVDDGLSRRFTLPVDSYHNDILLLVQRFEITGGGVSANLMYHFEISLRILTH